MPLALHVEVGVEITVYSSSNPYFNALISESWWDVGEDNVVTVSFVNEYGRSWSDYEKQAFTSVFAAYETVCNVSFQFTNDPSDADLTENLVTSQQMSSIIGPQGWHGWQDEPSLSGSKGFFDYTKDYWSASLDVGSRGHYLILHEIGHSLGLEHPHSTWHGSGLFPGVSLNASKDTGDYGLNITKTTAMSYNYNYSPSYSYGQTAGPMAFDIAALQEMYGARDHATGDDSYYLPDVNDVGTYWSCIWDTGGTDEIAYDGDRDVWIDLRAATLLREPGGGGYFSNAKGIYGGLSIANGVDIENARSGSGSDAFFANWLANELDGGDGVDCASYQFESEDLSIDLRIAGPQTSKGAASDDRLLNIENLTGGSGNDEFIGNGERNVFEGRGGNDNLQGGSGDDWLLGGNGTDRLFGDDGDDTLTGGYGGGRDLLSGGAGSDRFDFNHTIDSTVSYAGRDVILDFQPGIDDIDLSTIDANAKKAGNQVFKFIGSKSFSGRPGEVRYVQVNQAGVDDDKTYVYADTNGDRRADFQIELVGLKVLHSWDFIL